MSKGFGVWQQRIMLELEHKEYVYSAALLPSNYTKADQNALSRAAKILADAGEIEIVRYMAGNRRTLLCRPGCIPPHSERPDGYRR